MTPQTEKPLELVITWWRWTIGIAWDFMKNKEDGIYRLEISIQIPVVALSILIKNY